MFNCSICYDGLFTAQDAPATLGCGHVFHMSCLNACLDRKKECPICRKAARSRSEIIRLYFSSSDEAQMRSRNLTTAASSCSCGIEEISYQLATIQSSVQDMNQNYQKLVTEKKLLEEKFAMKNIQLEKLEMKLKRKKEQLKYVKELKKVIDLDKNLATTTAQQFMKSKEGESRDKLLLNTGILYTRWQKAESMNDDLLRQNSILLKHLRRSNTSHNRPQRDEPSPHNTICISDDDDIEIIPKPEEASSSITSTSTASTSTTPNPAPAIDDKKLKRKADYVPEPDIHETQEDFIVREDTPRKIPTSSRFSGKRAKWN